jgi:hypothetical protein
MRHPYRISLKTNNFVTESLPPVGGACVCHVCRHIVPKEGCVASFTSLGESVQFHIQIHLGRLWG